MCVRVRDESIYNECVDEWNRIDAFVACRKDLLFLKPLVKFSYDNKADRLSIDAFIFSELCHEAESSKSANVVLIGPSDAVLFKFPFDETNGCGLHGAIFSADNYNPRREYSKDELDSARLASADLPGLGILSQHTPMIIRFTISSQRMEQSSM